MGDGAWGVVVVVVVVLLLSDEIMSAEESGLYSSFAKTVRQISR